jgi:hypothetical protein
VIVAHQLLKNDIVLHEYWLVTPPVAGRNSSPAGFATWMEWNSSAIQTESGEIPFHYTQIGQLKTELVPEPIPPLELASQTKVLSFSREYATDIRTLFHATGDFHYRSRWQEGVKIPAASCGAFRNPHQTSSVAHSEDAFDSGYSVG